MNTPAQDVFHIYYKWRQFIQTKNLNSHYKWIIRIIWFKEGTYNIQGLRDRERRGKLMVYSSLWRPYHRAFDLAESLAPGSTCPLCSPPPLEGPDNILTIYTLLVTYALKFDYRFFKHYCPTIVCSQATYTCQCVTIGGFSYWYNPIYQSWKALFKN